MIDVANDKQFQLVRWCDKQGREILKSIAVYDRALKHCFWWEVVWNEASGKRLAWCLVNPAVEDAEAGHCLPMSRTAARMRNLMKTRASCGGFVAVNLHSCPAPRPGQITRREDSEWAKNELFLRHIAASHDEIVCAWGVEVPVLYVHRVLSLFQGNTLLRPSSSQLGIANHPSRLPGDTRLVKCEDAMWTGDRVVPGLRIPAR
jgi:hypothetical protein